MISLCISAWTCCSQPGLDCLRYTGKVLPRMGLILFPLHLLDPTASLVPNSISSIHDGKLGCFLCALRTPCNAAGTWSVTPFASSGG